VPSMQVSMFEMLDVPFIQGQPSLGNRGGGGEEGGGGG
jgi:hypothetical protein